MTVMANVAGVSQNFWCMLRVIRVISNYKQTQLHETQKEKGTAHAWTCVKLMSKEVALLSCLRLTRTPVMSMLSRLFLSERELQPLAYILTACKQRVKQTLTPLARPTLLTYVAALCTGTYTSRQTHR